MGMNGVTVSSMAAAVSLCLLAPGVSMASERGHAIQLCENKIRNVYDVSNFRHVETEQLGNHKYKVYGKVKVDHRKYPFQCKVKNGHIKSYAYNGPSQHHRDDDDDDDNGLGTALAVGAGLAIIAAVAASQADDSQSDKSSQLPVKESVLEDDCHDMLQYRVRDEHDYTARVNLTSSRIKGHALVGEAKVKYDRDHPHRATYTCHFDSHGRVMDSSYHLY